MRLKCDVFPAGFALNFRAEQILFGLDIGECATRGGKKERETERNLLEIEKETEMLLLDFQAAIALAYEINKIIYILYMQF